MLALSTLELYHIFCNKSSLFSVFINIFLFFPFLSFFGALLRPYLWNFLDIPTYYSLYSDLAIQASLSICILHVDTLTLCYCTPSLRFTAPFVSLRCMRCFVYAYLPCLFFEWSLYSTSLRLKLILNKTYRWGDISHRMFLIWVLCYVANPTVLLLGLHWFAWLSWFAWYAALFGLFWFA